MINSSNAAHKQSVDKNSSRNINRSRNKLMHIYHKSNNNNNNNNNNSNSSGNGDLEYGNISVYLHGITNNKGIKGTKNSLYNNMNSNNNSNSSTKMSRSRRNFHKIKMGNNFSNMIVSSFNNPTIASNNRHTNVVNRE